MTKRAALLISVAIVLILGLYSAWLYTFTLPEHLQVNGLDWRVLRTDFPNYKYTIWGLTECGRKIIWIRTGLPSSDVAEVLVHESMHAVTCDYDGDVVHNDRWDNDTQAHAGIWFGAPRMVSLIAANPRYALFVSRYGRKLTPISSYTAGNLP